jgi:AAA family ATP:ADP antiporter
VVYRTGDQLGIWSASLLSTVGLGTAGVALVAIPIAALWLVNALWLGRRQEVLAAEQEAEPEPHLTGRTAPQPVGGGAGG